MYPVSEAFLRAVQENTRRYYWTGRITTKGGAVYPFGYEDIVKGSGYISAQIFPLMEVRCISVNDHYDSEGVLGTAGGLNVAFKNLVNMLYSRDLSKKIRSAQMARARKGEYLGGFARYGYEKSPEDKHRLVVDPEAAEVVRKIFTMAAEGVTVSGIARYLNDNGVLTCVEYKQRKNSRYQHPGGGVKKLWAPVGALYFVG